MGSQHSPRCCAASCAPLRHWLGSHRGCPCSAGSCAPFATVHYPGRARNTVLVVLQPAAPLMHRRTINLKTALLVACTAPQHTTHNTSAGLAVAAGLLPATASSPPLMHRPGSHHGPLRSAFCSQSLNAPAGLATRLATAPSQLRALFLTHRPGSHHSLPLPRPTASCAPYNTGAPLMHRPDSQHGPPCTVASGAPSTHRPASCHGPPCSAASGAPLMHRPGSQHGPCCSAASCVPFTCTGHVLQPGARSLMHLPDSQHGPPCSAASCAPLNTPLGLATRRATVYSHVRA